MPGIVRPLAHLAVTALLVSACGGDGASGVVSADGRLEVTGAWVWATPPTSEEAAVYLAVRNSGDTDDRLLGAQSGRCMSMLPHETTIDADGVSRMTEATAAEMRVPAGGELVLEPRALHLMCVGLATPLVDGEAWEVQLGFEQAGAVTVSVEVRPLG
ncbi:MAG: copper chaperone PCu(A)C [Acidimicrobiales bacterium]|nr:copper chaperone PCu(A)C [Acidimicrobiales bacterium]MCB9394837.1 copper chaperone PCu(A)C [Acidimicrobiaceae bacterium]